MSKRNHSTGSTIKPRCYMILFVIILAVTFSSFQTVLAASNNKELEIITWEGYVPEDMKKDFEKETGIKVSVTYFSDNGELISKLRATGGEGWDLAQPSSYQIRDSQQAFNIYQPLDFSKITIMNNLISSHIRAAKANTSVDGKQYGLPFTWGSTGVIVNTNKIKKDTISFMDLYDDNYKGRLTIRYGWYSFAGAAYGKGIDYFSNTNNEKIYQCMMEEMLEFLVSKKKNIKTFWTTRQEQIDLMLSEECWISQGWDGTGFFLTKKNPDIKYFCPVEGALGWIDTFAIPAGAKNIDAAYKWINFMLTQKRGAQLSEKSGYLSAVKGAIDLLPEKDRNVIKEAYPPEAIDNLNWYAPLKPYVNEISADFGERFRVAK